MISVFDEYFDEGNQKYGKAIRDPNAYTTGRIGRHDVVVVHMPSMGKVSAASVAQGLKSSFQNIRLALVVGICGGVPYTSGGKRLVFLGDVIISKSLVQYDFGRRYDSVFEAKGSTQGGSGKQSAEIRSSLAKLETNHHRRQLERRCLEHLQQSLPRSTYPGSEKDILFHAASLHRHHRAGECHTCLSDPSSRICASAIESTCEELGCEEDSAAIQRVRSITRIVANDLTSAIEFQPSIHIGNMGSADTVMKSGTHRDEVAQRHNVIGFEMEGAGIWDFFDSLVIKAVCDYADSHKNKEWQLYAAATAAAATKAFLEQWGSEGDMLE